MSEYQYYEFAAIDQPLTHDEMAQLRAVSSRAEITRAGFVNHYEWGDLKANPADWMRRYFDAFIYTANWCSCRLALRVPLATFQPAELAPFANGDCLDISASDAHWIIGWSLDESEDYERFGTEDGRTWMRRLAPLRDELLRGDLRSLYMGWLAAAHALDDDATEPPVPPGLAQLSPAQQALAEFIEVDPDLLAAAAAGSACGLAPSVPSAELDAWLGEWSREDMVAMLKLIAQGEGHEAERRVRLRQAAWMRAQRPLPSGTAPLRDVALLHELAQSAAIVRVAREAELQAAQEAERRKQREASLRQLMRDVDRHWANVDALAQRGSARGYEQAVQAAGVLAQGYALTSSPKEFERALRRVLVRHASRGALLRRLTDAGLLPK